MKTYDAVKAIEAQKRYCDENNCPYFAPPNGWCSRCGRNIFEPYTYRKDPPITIGYSVEDAGAGLITNCPHCSATFVD